MQNSAPIAITDFEKGQWEGYHCEQHSYPVSICHIALSMIVLSHIDTGTEHRNEKGNVNLHSHYSSSLLEQLHMYTGLPGKLRGGSRNTIKSLQYASLSQWCQVCLSHSQVDCLNESSTTVTVMSHIDIAIKHHDKNERLLPNCSSSCRKQLLELTAQ